MREVVKKAYQNRIQSSYYLRLKRKLGVLKPTIREVMSEHILIQGYKDQHGAYFQIPKDSRSKKIVSVMRNPTDRFDSEFRFEWWKKHPHVPMDIIRGQLPNFPELSLKEYILYRKLLANHLKGHLGISEKVEMGDQTITFLYMFLKEPHVFFRKMGDSLPDAKDVRANLCDLSFLKQENLNQDLFDFLRTVGFLNTEIEFIKKYKKVNVSPDSESSHFKEEVRTYVHKVDAIMIEVLRDFGIEY